VLGLDKWFKSFDRKKNKTKSVFFYLQQLMASTKIMWLQLEQLFESTNYVRATHRNCPTTWKNFARSSR